MRSTDRSFGHDGDEVTQPTIDAYAEMSGDFNPLHVDLAVAEASEFGGIIAHGPIALQSFFRAAVDWLGVEALPAGSSVSVTYRHPVRPGDRVSCAAESIELDEAGAAAIRASCSNQSGTAVVTVAAVLPNPPA